MIRVGIIGGGLNSAVGKAHLTAISMTNYFSIVGACFSRKTELNYSTAKYFNIPSDFLYNDYKKLVTENENKIDIMIILTPTDQHAEQVVLAIKHGFSVICEKALTSSIDEVLKIKKYLTKSNSRLYVIYNYLGYPMVKEMKHLIHSSKIGKVLSVHIEMPQEGFIRTSEGTPITPQNWRLKDQNIPTISLDLGVHLHIIMHYLTGEKPLKTSSVSRSQGNFPGIIDDVNALIEYSNSITCNMWYSKTACGHRNGLKIRLYGDKGSIAWFQMEPETLHFSDIEGNTLLIDRNSPNIIIAKKDRYNRFKGGHPAGFVEALSNYYIDLAESFNARENLNLHDTEVFGIEEAIEGLYFLQAISKSSLENRWVEI